MLSAKDCNMTTQQQEQRSDLPQKRSKQRRMLSRRALVIITVLVLAVAIIITWILSYLKVIPSFWASIFTIIITVLGAVFAFFQSMHLFVPVDRDELPEAPRQRNPDFNLPLVPAPTPQIPSIIVQLPSNQSPFVQMLTSDKTAHRGIVGLPPPTDPRTIEQREHVVKEVYTKLTQPDITCVALTGIGGVGKSTLAALIYRYVEEQRQTHTSPFQAETLWFTVDPAVTFADLAGNLFEELGKPLLDLSNLAPQNQAVVLFNALITTDEQRLIIFDQFENLLDWDTGHALADRPGIGEWLDMLNSQQCNCRVLLTSRPRPVGTREYPPTYLQEYLVIGLEPEEGVALLRNQGVQGTDEELQVAVSSCAGHAFSLTLLASLLRNHHLDLTVLIKRASLWTGDIASNLLDQIYQERLNDVQRELLLAFSVYREPVPMEAAQTIITYAAKGQLASALKALHTQRLLEAVGGSRYQLHAIIAEYAQTHFDESSEQANEEALQAAHTRAAQYFLEQAEKNCPPREQRRRVNDVRDLIEAIWQLCQAEHLQEAYNLIEQEEILSDLKQWGSNAILLELCLLLQPRGIWSPKISQRAFIHRNIAWAYNASGKGKWARENYEQALKLYTESGDLDGQANILDSLGWSYYVLGQMKQAKEYYEQSINICKEIGKRRGVGHALNGLGRVSIVEGQKKQALEYFEQALAISKEVGDPRLEGRTLSNLGLVHTDFRNYMKALEYLEQSLAIRKQVGDRRGESVTLNNLGRVYKELGQNESAVKCFEEALSMSQEIGDRGSEGWTLNNLGWAYNALGQYEQARKILEQALDIRKEVGDRRGESRTIRNLGWSYSMLGQKMQALEYYKQALGISQDIQDPYDEGTILHNIAIVYFDQARYDVALSFFLLAIRIFDEIQSLDKSDTQKWITTLRGAVGDEQFTVLLTAVDSQAQQIVDRALGESKQLPG
jgi:tetratricopeptide (TPR) repeat protein